MLMGTDVPKWDLKKVSQFQLRQNNYEVAVIPVGAVEAHNRHLPEGMDVIHAEHVAQNSCRMAWEECESVICLPAVPFGVDSNLMSFPLTVHVSQKALDTYLYEIIRSVRHHGIRKVVIINGHGGNDFRPLVREVQYETDVYMFLCDWWKVGSDVFTEMFGEGDDHGGVFETSVALEICPELVDVEKAGAGQSPPFRFEALQKGWVSTSRDFSKLNDHCAISSTAKADADKGKEYISIVCDRVSRFLVELAQSEIDDSFPMKKK